MAAQTSSLVFARSRLAKAVRVMTVDLEFDYDSFRSQAVEQTLPELLDFFKSHDIEATFFTVGMLAEKYPKILGSIARKHELASHSYSHVRLDRLTRRQALDELQRSKAAVEKAAGKKVFGFRAPFFITRKDIHELLEKTGYKYDSSFTASWFPGRYFNVFGGQKPYRNPLFELPVPNFTFLQGPPAGFSYYKLFPQLSRMVFRKPYLVYLHPNEFLEARPGTEIPPLVRSLYSIGRGKKAWNALESFIGDDNFVSCSTFIRKFLRVKL